MEIVLFCGGGFCIDDILMTSFNKVKNLFFGAVAHDLKKHNPIHFAIICEYTIHIVNV